MYRKDDTKAPCMLDSDNVAPYSGVKYYSIRHSENYAHDDGIYKYEDYDLSVTKINITELEREFGPNRRTVFVHS